MPKLKSGGVMPKERFEWGATGPSGLRTVEFALKRQHTLTLYVRSPHKLPESISLSPLVTIVQGELTDVDKLASCFTSSTATANPIYSVISALGPKVGQPSGNPITAGYEILIAKMREFGVPRLVLLSTVSVASPRDKFSAVREGLVAGIRIVGYSAWTDVIATGKLVETQMTRGGLAITLVRVPTLTNGKGGSLHIGFIGDGNQGWTLTREDFAIFCVQEAEIPEWSGEAPLISSSLW